jgi:hypothetical protein
MPLWGFGVLIEGFAGCEAADRQPDVWSFDATDGLAGLWGSTNLLSGVMSGEAKESCLGEELRGFWGWRQFCLFHVSSAFAGN